MLGESRTVSCAHGMRYDRENALLVVPMQMELLPFECDDAATYCSGIVVCGRRWTMAEQSEAMPPLVVSFGVGIGIGFSESKAEE